MKTKKIIISSLMLMSIPFISVKAINKPVLNDNRNIKIPETSQRENDKNLSIKADMNIRPRIGGGERTVKLPGYKQETNYYCGPASVQNIIYAINGNKIAQSELARQLGTTQSSGTYVYKIAEVLNNNTSIPNFYFAYSNMSNRSLHNAIISNSDKGIPTILNVDSKKFGLGFSGGHYVVGYGYKWGAQGSSGYSYYKVYDPYLGKFREKEDTLTVEDYVRANGGYFIW